MIFFSELKRIFQLADIAIIDRFDTTEASFDITYYNLPTVDIFSEVLNLIPCRDKISLKLINDSEDIVYFNNHITEPVDFSSFTYGMVPEDNINVKVQIDKTVFDGRFSIYNYESFVTNLLSWELSEIMKWFAQHLCGCESLLFEVFDCDISFSTRTMAFESSNNALLKSTINRSQRLNECRKTAYFYNMDIFEIIPDDFIVQGIVITNNRLQTLFGKIATILSLAYVSSSSAIEDGKLKIQINGHRINNFDIALTNINEDEKWQNIYTWIYTDGNPTDKSLIAHNVISLHCKFETILNLDGTVFEAIKTNYNLYLRNNVDTYLKMKHDIAKFIQDVVSKIGDYAVEILDKFKANLLAIFAFLFTVVLTQIGSAQEWEEIFTRHTIYLIEIFVAGSLIYLLICFFETKYKLNKTKKGYFAIKENYKDLLSSAELSEAFQADKYFKYTEKVTNRGIIIWSIIWGFLLILSIIIIECLTNCRGLIVWLYSKFC